MNSEYKIVFTEFFRDIIKRLQAEDIENLCRTDKFFKQMCKTERDYIKRELYNRIFYVRIETYPDEIPGDLVHTVVVTKNPPIQLFSDFVETHRFERLDYPDRRISNAYVVFHFTDFGTDVVELFFDKQQAEQFFRDNTSNENTGIYEGDENGTAVYYTLYDDDDNYANSRWALLDVNIDGRGSSLGPGSPFG